MSLRGGFGIGKTIKTLLKNVAAEKPKDLHCYLGPLMFANQAASVACVLEDEETDEAVVMKDADTLPAYNLKQKVTVDAVIINPELRKNNKHRCQ